MKKQENPNYESSSYNPLREAYKGNNQMTNNNQINSNSAALNENSISRTFLSEENQDRIGNKKYNSNYLSNNSNNNPENNYYYNKIKKQTIETVVENECEENCSYNQNSDLRVTRNDPIVTFLFYKQAFSTSANAENKADLLNKSHSGDYKDNYNPEIINYKESENFHEEMNFKKQTNSDNFANADRSLSLNINKSKIEISNKYDNLKNENINNKESQNNYNNNQTNLNIHELIDNISQSEIFSNIMGKKDKSFSIDNFNLSKVGDLNVLKNTQNKNENQANNNSDNNNNANNNNQANNKENNDENTQQTEKLNVLFSEIVEACPIIQLSADTSKVL